ncbi:uncharacterized protein LOC110019866 [Phalaenopsis equestris]|uniref:uncharacterized protein LOC110019866 n=1 Tax=Phalaenopsis equestris TaxID=78828 RepID=UPI0009E4B2AA|nr:uncharacterized protein LOC110019866 [Phalaenopsis equestris]
MAATLLLSPNLPRQLLTTLSRAPARRQQTYSLHQRTRRLVPIHAITTQKEKENSSSAEEITKKYGLEFGLWNIFRSGEEERGTRKKSKTDEAKELLAKYGGAYLATSITLSLISFALCYLLVSAGIDVQALLSKVGIAVDETGEKVGTFALAYAAHKAASPIRFPPTVALTPIVAGWIGKRKTAADKKEEK